MDPEAKNNENQNDNNNENDNKDEIVVGKEFETETKQKFMNIFIKSAKGDKNKDIYRMGYYLISKCPDDELTLNFLSMSIFI